MQSDVHEWFTRLEIWFKKMSTPPYPRQSHPHPGPLRNPIYLPLPPEMSFTTPDNENLPVPFETARYLCQGRPVFWGIDKQDRIVEDLGVLAEDGNSVEVLSSALLKSMNQPLRQVPNLLALLHLHSSTRRSPYSVLQLLYQVQ